MNERPKRVFLERQNYRRRRLIDFIRMVPVFGAILWAVPLLWSTEEGRQVATSDAIVFIFFVWFALVGVGCVLARALRDGNDGSARTQD
ncbi:hypothetical protein [Shimia haliotis]|uniref:Uncharacterized protein n=1 Tax=Shimia haliotis TaxID=1280847 RepID=A0A1I4HAM3_9RHOB|nr:hypothetical protein [Shimia haliotis]SFL39264.1 hypothetical protein SAMN04488036_1129 [Shimia haliotis]